MQDLFQYSVPYRNELKEMGYVPIKSNRKIEREVEMIFSNPLFPHRELFIAVNRTTKGTLAKRMANYAFAVVKYYMEYPQRFGNNIENIHMDLLVIMWKIIFSFTTRFEKWEIREYLKVPKRTLKISDELIEQCIIAVESDDVIWDVKERDLPPVVYDPSTGKKLTKKDKGYSRGRVSMYGTEEGTKNFERLCKLADDEIGSLL